MGSRFLRKDLKNFSPYLVTNYPNCIKLDANENPFELPSEIKERISIEARNTPFRLYPDPNILGLRECLSRYIGVDRNNIAVGNGSDEILQIIFTAFVDEGDIAMYPVLSFEMFGILSQIFRVNSLILDLNKELQLDIEDTIEKLRKYSPKLFLLCRPNNPTGWSMERKDVIAILEEAKKIDTLVVIDEAYGEFARESVIGLLPNYDNLIILRTFSKAFSLAGLRVGYAISNREIIEDIMAVKLPYNVDVFSQRVASIVLEYRDIINKRVDYILKERERVYETLKTIHGLKVFPSQANFLFFYCEEPSLMEKLIEHGIKIRMFSGGHPLLDKAYRVTIGKMEDNDRFLRAMEEILN
ncbi:MAG: histidinol-phosphate transaminase [bacterium]